MKRDEFFSRMKFYERFYDLRKPYYISLLYIIYQVYYISYYISGFNNILFRISLNAINNFYEFEIKFNNTLD